MKTLRYRIGDEVKPGILDKEENIRDASSIVKDWDNYTVTVENLNSVMDRNLSDLPIESWKNKVKNDFENNVFEVYPQLKIEKEKFYYEGAIYSSMTGTGSTIYGIFKK